MNAVNIFFPTEFLRDDYIKKIFSIDEISFKNNTIQLMRDGVESIYCKSIHRQIPGFWVSIHLMEGETGKRLLKKIRDNVPIYWFEKYVFFPTEVDSTKIMEEKWRQKYCFKREFSHSKAWNIFFKEAQIHLQMGRSDVAYAALLFIYKNNPYFLKKYRRYYIFEDLAYYCDSNGDLPKSIRCLQIQASLQPKSTEPYLNMSSFLLLNGLYEEAIDVCERGLEINEEDEYLCNNLLTAYFHGKYYDTALQYLQKLIKKSPEKSTYWKLMGDIFCEVNKLKLAITSYHKAISVSSEDICEIKKDIYYGLGVCHQHLKQFKEAIRYYKKLLKLNQSDPAALLNLSKIYGDDLREYDKAQYYAEQMVSLYPQDGYGHHNLGLVYLYTKQLEKAKWHLYKARKMIPDYEPVHEAIDELRKVKRE